MLPLGAVRPGRGILVAGTLRVPWLTFSPPGPGNLTGGQTGPTSTISQNSWLGLSSSPFCPADKPDPMSPLGRMGGQKRFDFLLALVRGPLYTRLEPRGFGRAGKNNRGYWPRTH